MRTHAVKVQVHTVYTSPRHMGASVRQTNRPVVNNRSTDAGLEQNCEGLSQRGWTGHVVLLKF